MKKKWYKRLFNLKKMLKTRLGHPPGDAKCRIQVNFLSLHNHIPQIWNLHPVPAIHELKLNRYPYAIRQSL